jgi:hypothetical protein
MVAAVTGNKAHALAVRGHDLYETPAAAVTALMRYVKLPGTILEPSCGPGAIVRVLREAGHKVIAADLIDYGWTPDFDAQGGVDFLKMQTLPRGVQAIVTNPPFKDAQQFVAHARSLCPRVIMLLRLAFYESERRSPILDAGDLSSVLCFRKRLPMMHRAGWEGPKASSGMAFAWYVWDRNHRGPARLRRISWDRQEEPQPLTRARPDPLPTPIEHYLERFQ